RKIVMGLLLLGVSWTQLIADVSEMIFYPQADFSEGLLHFNYQGTKNKNYGFMFDKGFDPNRIVYVRPENNSIERLKDGSVKLSFANTDRYSYVQRAYKDDFLVSEEGGVYTILLSGGDCKSSPDCVTAENILTVNVPKGYGVRKYQGLDQDLKPLKTPRWQIKGNIYTLTALDVKGACVMMEIEKLKPGQKIIPKTVTEIKPLKAPVLTPPTAETKPAAVATATKILMPEIIDPSPIEKPEPKVEKPMTVAAVKPTEPKIAPVVPKAPAIEKPVLATRAPIIDKPSVVSPEPAPYFRNFQLFDNRVVVLNEAGKERLRKWAKAFKASGKKMIIINSYTDNIPPRRLKHLYATNEIISEARGKLVAEYLAGEGIDPKIITVNGMGDANPVASNDTEEGRSKNRRIEFVLN
ncbi:MAG: OmpA family protein, partial [Epsilonproteobacteria bacterium]|nr:OmpA family protein [Campylobacterota bacterium]